MNEEATDRFRIVLCRTEGPGNLGSVCRAMKAMGFRHLDLVAPTPTALQAERVKEMAVHAFEVFENARHFTNLEDALADSRLTAAFARRQGSLRKSGFRDLPGFREEVRETGEKPGIPGPISLVFGNEKHGLTREEVAACTFSVQIPTHPDFPSLNLAQAVQIACWELRQIPKKNRNINKRLQLGDSSPPVLLTVGEASALGAEVVSIFRNLGFYALGGEDKAREVWRDLFTRAGLEKSESAWIKGTFGKLRGLNGSAGTRNN